MLNYIASWWSLETVGNWATVVTAGFAAGITVWFFVTPHLARWWFIFRGSWPVTVRLVNFVGLWEHGEYVTAYVRVKPRWRTWSQRSFPRVTRIMLVGDFSKTASKGSHQNRSPVLKNLEYAPGQEEPVDRSRTLKIELQVSEDLAGSELLCAHVLVWVKYPPFGDRTFETEPMKMNVAGTGPYRDGYGQQLL